MPISIKMANIVTLYIPILPKPLLIDFPVAVGEDVVAMDSNRIPVFKKTIHKIKASWNDVRNTDPSKEQSNGPRNKIMRSRNSGCRIRSITLSDIASAFVSGSNWA